MLILCRSLTLHRVRTGLSIHDTSGCIVLFARRRLSGRWHTLLVVILDLRRFVCVRNESKSASMTSLLLLDLLADAWFCIFNDRDCINLFLRSRLFVCPLLCIFTYVLMGGAFDFFVAELALGDDRLLLLLRHSVVSSCALT